LNGGRSVWRLEHHQLDDLRMVIEAVMTDRKKHKPRPNPDRPDGKAAARRKRDTPQRRRKLADARRRARERRARKEAGWLEPPPPHRGSWLAMANDGYATLQVIPSLPGFESTVKQQL